MDIQQRWLDQVEGLARERLSTPVYRYIREGAREEISAREAEDTWRGFRLMPRVLRDVRHVELSCRLLETSYAVPIGVPPMTLQRAAHPDGEVAMASAAAAAGAPVVISSNAGARFEQIQDTGADWWLQIYLGPERERSLPVLHAARAAGAAAVVLTVDTPVVGTRFVPEAVSVWDTVEPGWFGANLDSAGAPDVVHPALRDKAADLGPDDIAWLGSVTGLPVVVKGVLRGEDARRCVAAGAAAIWVSHHGGRQLDQTEAPARCVESVRAAVGEAAQIFVDGGLRSGLHALVAFALGADAVFVGRPLFYALGADGENGVRRALDELRAELEEAMRLSGTPHPAAARGLLA